MGVWRCLSGFFYILHCGNGLPSCGDWLPQKWQRVGTESWQKELSSLILNAVMSGVGFYSCGSGKDTQIPSIPKILVPISPHFSLQVFQKCTVKDVVVKNLVEATTRIDPQIRELRPGALLPLKEKKVKYMSLRSCPANCLPLPTVWYNRWLCLNPFFDFCTLALAQEKPVTAASKTLLSLLPHFPFLFLILLDITARISTGLSLHKMMPLKRCCVFCVPGPDNDVFCHWFNYYLSFSPNQ